MEQQAKKLNKANRRLVFNIIPAFLIVFVFFFVLTRNKIIDLSKDKFVIESQNYADKVSFWADEILSALSVYKDYADKLGIDDPQTFTLFDTSYEKYKEIPYGIYWGNKDGDYYDASGWEPDDDYVVPERTWYIEGLEHEQLAFGEPYVDAMTNQTCVSVTARTGVGEKESVMSADVYLDYASELVDQITKTEVQTAFFAMVPGNMIIASSEQSTVGSLLSDDRLDPLYAKVDKLLRDGKTGIFSVRSGMKMYFVNIAEVKNTDWHFITVVKRQKLLSELYTVEIAMLIATVIAATNLIIVVIRIVRQLVTTNQKAKSDPLTGIFNRAGFKEIVGMGMESDPDQGALFIMDMDHFKEVNDQLGHPEGDVVLQEFAKLLENYFNRNKDVVARMGGDEFAVYVGRDISRDEARLMLTKFMDNFHQKFDEKYAAQKLSVSIGGAFHKGGMSYNEMYKKADDALYVVKSSGKNNFIFSA